MLGTQWIARKLASAVIAAVPLALEYLVEHFSEWVYRRVTAWRETIRRRIWWKRKLASLLTPGTADDRRADAIGNLMLFVHPPEDSGWRLEGSVYLPREGSGYIRTGTGEYVRITGV